MIKGFFRQAPVKYDNYQYISLISDIEIDDNHESYTKLIYLLTQKKINDE